MDGHRDVPDGPSWGGIVLSGGGAARMDGVDKASIEIDGETLLEHVLSALRALPEVVVVGPEVSTSRPVTFTREEPAGGGPAAGLLAGFGRSRGRPTWCWCWRWTCPG